MVKRYLDLISLERALALIRESFSFTPGTEVVPLGDAAGRVTAAPVFARFSVPEVHLSAMDGIAVRSAETTGAHEQHPVTLADAAPVNTGNVIPPGYNAVIMIEDVWVDDGAYTIRRAAAPWQHVRAVGEDLGESEMVLPSLHRIRPHEIGALTTYGLTDLEVLHIRVGLIPTGSELVPPGVRPPPGKVIESNTLMASALLRDAGADCRRYGIVADDPALIRDAVVQGIDENDLLLISAGSSAGTRDYTADVISELGEVLAHGVAIKPGKPVIIGRISGKPVIGLPGYPLAAFTVLREIVMPLLGCYGIRSQAGETISARLSSTLHSDIGTDEFVLVSAGRVGGAWVAVPHSRGAGVQMSAVRANAYIKIPAASEGASAGSLATARLMVPRARAEEALLITGSHDPALDHLADLVARRRAGADPHFTHVGSMGGLLALKRHDCHAAPMHLLASDGDYNLPYLTKYLPGEDLVLVCIAERQQGIASRDALTLDDLPAHTFVNRQKGSGTRMLLDHLLAERGIDAGTIQGYDREVTTHLAAALSVKSRDADACICVYSAAQALGLEFAPVGTERYELVMQRDSLSDRRMEMLVETIASDDFIAILESLGGYETRFTGVRRELL